MTFLKRHNPHPRVRLVEDNTRVSDLNRCAEHGYEPLDPMGRPMTLEDLPPTTTRRWVARRKAEVVSAVRGGLITLQDACRRYSLSEDEYLSWEKLIDDHGLKGLHTTRTQQYRNIAQRKARRPDSRAQY